MDKLKPALGWTILLLFILSEKDFVFGCSGGGDEIAEARSNPVFQKRDCKDVPEANGAEADLCLKINYPDKENDVAIMYSVWGEETVFEGSLAKEKLKITVVLQEDNVEEAEVTITC